jgi:hypothetical protein
MKKQLRLVLGKVYRVPVFGYLLEIFVVAIRLPLLRARVRRLEERLYRRRPPENRNGARWLDGYDISSNDLSEHVAAFRQHLPAFVSAISSVRSLSQQVAQMTKATQNLEVALSERDERIQLLEQIVAEMRGGEGGSVALASKTRSRKAPVEQRTIQK